MISVSIVLSIVEASFSNFIFAFPGFKLGLANIATMIVVFTLGRKEGLIVVLLRITLVGLVYYGLFTPSFYISLSGGMLSLFMLLLLKNTKLSIMTISVLSASMHMIGQILAAIVVVNTVTLIYYLPYMLMLSVPTGLITGYLAKKLIDQFKQQLVEIK